MPPRATKKGNAADAWRARNAEYYARKKAGLVTPRVRLTDEERRTKARARSRKAYYKFTGKTADQIRPMATREGMKERRDALYNIVSESPPMTVRQVFYQAEVRGLEGIEKNEAGYQKVATCLVNMRRDGTMPFEWIIDNTREISKGRTYPDIAAALDHCARTFYLDFWTNAKERVQVWIEKDALAAQAAEVTEIYDVPLIAARGVPSWSILHEAAQRIDGFDGLTNVYYFADFDPKGEEGWQLAKSALAELAPNSNINFEHVAVTLDQIDRFHMPTRPTKGWENGDKRARQFGRVSCELDAFSPDQFRALIRGVIERHLPPTKLTQLQRQEKKKRTEIRTLIDNVK